MGKKGGTKFNLKITFPSTEATLPLKLILKQLKHILNVKEKNKIIYSFFILGWITFQVLSLTLFKYDLDLYNIFIK